VYVSPAVRGKRFAHASLNFTQVAGGADIGIWLTICLDCPRVRISFVLADPRFFSFVSVAVGTIWSAGAVGSLKSEVPIGSAGLT
jgi:hypothetical protein